MNDDRLRHLQRLLERREGEARASGHEEAVSETARPAVGEVAEPDDALVSAAVLRQARNTGAMAGRASRWCGRQGKQIATIAVDRLKQLRAATAERVAGLAHIRDGVRSFRGASWSESDVVTQPSATVLAQSRLRRAFLLTCLLAAGLGGAWWWMHGRGATDPGATKPDVSVPSEIAHAPSPSVPAVEQKVPPDQAVPPGPAPDVDKASAAVGAGHVKTAPPPPTRTQMPASKPKPPERTDDWQDKAQSEMDAWAQQMGIE